MAARSDRRPRTIDTTDRCGLHRRRGALLLAAGLIVGAGCGGGSDVDDGAAAGPESPTTAAVAVAVELAPDLAVLGDLAVLRSTPVTAVVGPDEAALDLDDGATVLVPAGAFAEPIELTAAVVDLDFDRYVTGLRRGAAYVLSVDTSLDLAVPVVLEVPIPADDVTVLASTGAGWRPVEITAGDTTRIPIQHFSQVIRLVTRRPDGELVPTDAAADGFVPGQWLVGCVAALVTIGAIGAGQEPDQNEDYVDVAGDAVGGWAWSTCTRALVDKYTPSGESVELSCVGEKIEQDTSLSLFGAVDACLRDQRGEPARSSVPPPDAATAFPRTYRAEDGVYYLTDFAYDIPFDCTAKGPMELTLAEDGTATFTYFDGVGVVATLAADGTPQISCEPRPGTTWTGTYDPELLTFEILPPTPEGFASWDVGGTFDDEAAFAYGVYSLPPNPAGQQLIVEIEASLSGS